MTDTLTAGEKIEAIKVVNGLLAKFAHDSDLQDDLKQPQVQVAMRHWTGENRLPPEQAERLVNDYRIMSVLQKIKALQVACQRAGLAVPLDHVMRGDTELRIPGVAATLAQATAEKEKGPTASSVPPTSSDKQVNKKEGTAKKATSSSPSTKGDRVPIRSTAPTSSSVIKKRKRRKFASSEKLPETFLDWWHLATPFIMIITTIIFSYYFRDARPSSVLRNHEEGLQQ